MIIDLNLRDKTVIVIGGGNEAQKRISILLKQKCKIIVLSPEINSEIKKLAKTKKILYYKQKVTDTKFISKFKPFMVITTTDDHKLNKKIINSSKKRRVFVYSSDNPEESDFANPAIIDFENTIQIAIFTGGRSPVMSKKIKSKSEKIFKKIITKEDLNQIKIQEIARTIAKSQIKTQIKRKEFLKKIMNNKEIKQLIKEGKPKKAKSHIIRLSGDWK